MAMIPWPPRTGEIGKDAGWKGYFRHLWNTFKAVILHSSTRVICSLPPSRLFRKVWWWCKGNHSYDIGDTTIGGASTSHVRGTSFLWVDHEDFLHFERKILRERNKGKKVKKCIMSFISRCELEWMSWLPISSLNVHAGRRTAVEN